jgi:CxxC-x17-CxxC domain-containing protein
MHQDKNISCTDCGEEFVFTAGEQEFYAAKGFTNEPTRCKPCRQRRKGGRGEGGGGGSSGGGSYGSRPQRELFDVKCDECGQQTQVPFRPSQDRPVYCRDCFNRRRSY